MLRPAEFFRYLIALGSLLMLASQAQAHVGNTEGQEVQHWLHKIPLAAQNLNYSGTFVYQQGSRARTSRITHVVQGNNELEKLEVLDGRPREYVRKNEKVVYYAPDEKAMLVEQRVMQEGFPAILSRDADQLASYYLLRFGESVRVAGYDSQELVLEPRDKLRYGYRLWVEKSSGLLLRAQTVSGNRILEQIEFIQLALGNISPQLVLPSYANVRGWRVEHTALQHVDVPGLNMGFMPPGFTQIAAVKRHLSRTAANTRGEGGKTATAREVVQFVYSDGLAAISIFIEPGIQSATEGFIQQGAATIIGKRLGDFRLTIVGEVPVAAVRQLAHSIEFNGHQTAIKQPSTRASHENNHLH